MIINIHNGVKQKIMRYINKTAPWAGQYMRRLQFRIKCLAHKSKIRTYILKKTKEKKFPLFNLIEIETINRCNGACSFCPVNRSNDSRPYSVMSEKLFYSIVKQLCDLNYSGELALSSNNEPLLDRNIVRYCSYAKRELPGATLILYTNGTLLTQEIFVELTKSLDNLVIDNYVNELDGYKLIKPVQELYDKFRDHHCYDHVEINIRRANEILYSRGGNAPNRAKIFLTTNCPCVLPYRQMVIRPDGKVSLCCADALGQMTLGDAEKTPLVDIWNNDIYRKIRADLLKSRALIKLCSGCDAIQTPSFLNNEL